MNCLAAGIAGGAKSTLLRLWLAARLCARPRFRCRRKPRWSRTASERDRTEETMDWIGQHAPAATQEGGEQAKQAKNFNKRREDHVEVQVSGGRIQSIFVT